TDQASALRIGSATARNILDAAYGPNSRNPLTPERLRVYDLRNRTRRIVGVAELATGTGLSGDPAFGVTVALLEADGTVLRGGRLCTLLPSRELAEDYIERLQTMARARDGQAIYTAARS